MDKAGRIKQLVKRYKTVKSCQVSGCRELDGRAQVALEAGDARSDGRVQ